MATEIFLPITKHRDPVIAAYHASLPYERGAIMRTADDGTQSLVPATRFADGRVEEHRPVATPAPPSSGDLLLGADDEVELECRECHRRGAARGLEPDGAHVLIDPRSVPVGWMIVGHDPGYDLGVPEFVCSEGCAKTYLEAR